MAAIIYVQTGHMVVVSGGLGAAAENQQAQLGEIIHVMREGMLELLLLVFIGLVAIGVIFRRGIEGLKQASSKLVPERIHVEQQDSRLNGVQQIPIEHKQSGEARQNANLSPAQENQKNASIVNTMLDGLICINKHGIILSMNPSAERMFSYEADEATGLNISMLMPEPESLHHGEYIQRYLDTGKRNIAATGRDVYGCRKDGEVFPMHLSISEVVLDNERLFFGLIRDISKQEAATDEAREKNNELKTRAAFDRIFAACITALFSNDNREVGLQIMLASLARHHPFPVSAVYVGDLVNTDLSRIASFGMAGGLKQEIKSGDGLIARSVERCETIVANLSDECCIEGGLVAPAVQAFVLCPITFHERVLGALVVGVAELPTELEFEFIRRLATQVGVSFDNFSQFYQLRDAFNQISRQSEIIQRKNEELEKANRMKSDFLANMSHELRTPLNGIIGFSEMMKDGVAGDLSDAQRGYCGEIYSSGYHLLGLINEILDLSAIEAGKMETEFADVLLGDVVESSVSLFMETAKERDITISEDIADATEFVCIDVKKTMQMLGNLLSNAVKFTPDGGRISVSVSLSSTPPSGDSEVGDGVLNAVGLPDADGSWLELRVSDTGIGIDPDNQSQIFTPFSQMDSSLSREYKGTGLGLPLVKGLAKLLGGRVEMESEPGKGSVFTIHIPYKPSSLAYERIESVSDGVLRAPRRAQ